LLTGRSRTALARHQTLRAAVDWSSNSLSEDETLPRRLSVFVGGGTLDAAASVCADGADLDAAGVLDGLVILVDKSLVADACGRATSLAPSWTPEPAGTRPLTGALCARPVPPGLRRVRCDG
jgi:predicted ATPase